MKHEFKNIRYAATPSEDFKKRLWQRLDAELPVASITRSRRRLVIAGSLASVIMIFSGSGAYAYSSPTMTPESPLYSIRMGIENVQERFKRTPGARAEFHEHMAERRGHELDHLQSEDHRVDLRIRLAELLDMTEEELNEASNNKELHSGISNRVHELRLEHEIETFEERRKFMMDRVDQAVESHEISTERAESIRNQLNSAQPGDLHRLHEAFMRSEGVFDHEHFNMRDEFPRMHSLMRAENSL